MRWPERSSSADRPASPTRQARFPDRGYEAQLERASALSLAINAIVVWNTRYLAAAADHLTTEGHPVPDSVWSHLSPLHWEHVHLVGRYSFNEVRLGTRLRPLREKPGTPQNLTSRLVG